MSQAQVSTSFELGLEPHRKFKNIRKSPITRKSVKETIKIDSSAQMRAAIIIQKFFRSKREMKRFKQMLINEKISLPLKMKSFPMNGFSSLNWIDISSKQPKLLTSNNDGSFYIINTDNLSIHCQYKLEPNSPLINCYNLNDNIHKLIVGYNDMFCRIWDISTSNVINTFVNK